ncbi:MAG: hypothetical protein GX625_16815 [Clostridiaceae bacterium]|nr:hypothetical protein [Clostridiaceae bacterium]
MSVNARKEQYEYIELFDKPGLFTNSRIDRDTVPKGWYAYDLRGSDYDPGEPVTVEPNVVVNHAGTVLMPEPVTIPKEGFRRLKGRLDFIEGGVTLQGFCEMRGLNNPDDTRTFALRPAFPDEAGLFYTQEEKDAELATVGHMRFDLGSGTEFWSTWWEHNGNKLNTPEFKAELQSFVDELRAGPLKSLSAMSSYCYTHGEPMDAGAGGSYGYVAESQNYRYCLRCAPRRGDYSYIYIYDKRQQELSMEQDTPIVGKVSFANGERISYTDADEYLRCIKEELEYRNTTGFQYETLTDDPAVRKAVDDEVYNLFGERNPNEVSDYEQAPTQGMTMGGM